MNPTMENILVPKQFADVMRQVFGDKRGVLWPKGNLQYQSFALDAAQNPTQVDIQGDFLYADCDQTGKVFIKFNDFAAPWIPLKTNTVIRYPIEKTWLRWTSQPGLVANLHWGYGAFFTPPNQDITSIGSITNPVDARPYGYTYGAAFSRWNIADPANTATAVVAPGSNVNGVTVWQSYQALESATTSVNSLLAKSSAPVDPADGDVLLTSYLSSTSATHQHLMNGMPVRVAAGKGIYWFNDALLGAVASIRSTLYTIH